MRTVFPLFLFALLNVSGWSATIYVPTDQPTVAAAVAVAAVGDTIEIEAGTYTDAILGSPRSISKAVTIQGATGGTTIQVTIATGYVFQVTGAGVVIQNLSINKLDKNGPHNMILIQGSNCTVQGCSFAGQYVLGDGDVSRAIEVAYNTSGLLIQNNTFTGLRQPAYFNPGVTADVLNNHVAGTRGWVVIGALINFTGNTWSGNAVDIYLNPDTPYGAPYDPISSLIARNKGAVIQDDRAGTNPYSVENLTKSTAYTTIQAAIDAADPRDVIQAGAATYAENVTIGKALTLQGVGDATIVSVAAGAAITVNASRVTVKSIKTTGGNSGINVGNGTDGVILESVTCTGATYGLLVQGDIATITDLSVTNCDMSGNTSCGAKFRGKVDGLHIDGGHFDNNQIGLYAEQGSSGLPIINSTIDGASFSGNGKKGIYVEQMTDTVLRNLIIVGSGNKTGYDWGAGIDINLKRGTYQNITISNCTVTNCGVGAANGVGITVKARGTGNDSSYAENPATLDKVTISGCEITGCQRGVRIGEPDRLNTGPTNVRVSCTFENNVLGDISNVTAKGNDVNALGSTFVGAADPAAIEARVEHQYDNAAFGWVIYDANQVLGNILAWDKGDRKFYLTGDASDPASGTEVENGKTYYYGGNPLVVNITGVNGDKQAVVSGASASNALRVRWYMLGGSLYRAYEWSTIGASAKTAVFQRGQTYIYGEGWQSGFRGFCHTISNGPTWDLAYSAVQQP